MVVGEEGTSLDDFIIYLKSEFLDAVYLQQNGFDKVDAATSSERQKYVSEKIHGILKAKFSFKDKEEARTFFYDLRQKFIDWNYTELNSNDFKNQEQGIDALCEGMNHYEKSV